MLADFRNHLPNLETCTSKSCISMPDGLTLTWVILSIVLVSIAVTPVKTLRGREVVARVNGHPIFQSQLDKRADVKRIFIAAQKVPLFTRFLITTEVGEEFMDEYRRYVLERLIREELFRQKAREFGIEVSDQEVQNHIQSTIKRNPQIKDLPDLKKTLTEDKRSLDELKSRIRIDLLEEKLKSRILDSVNISQSEIENYYQTHKESFRGKNGEVKPLSEIRESIVMKLKRKAKKEKWEDWIQTVRKDAEIVKKFPTG